MDVNLWIVTGRSGSGKTTFCQEVLGAVRLADWDVAGLLSPGFFLNGIKEAVFAQDIRSGKKLILATKRPQKTKELVFGDWYFNRKILEWGNQVLQASVPCDLLIVDELGPLEFNLSMGWVAAFDVILAARYFLALVVIRPELLEQAQYALDPTLTIQINDVDEVHSRSSQLIPQIMKLKGAE